MKKTIFLFITVCSLPLVSSAWPFNWEGPSSIYVPNGSGGTMLWPEGNAGYIFSMYLSANNTFEVGSDTLAYQADGRDVGAGLGTFYLGGQNTDTTPNIPLLSDPSYDYLLTVMYIGSPGSYTYYAVLGSTALPSLLPDGSNPYNITVAGVDSANVYTTFVAAVPEPSTVGLLLVGAGLVAFRRFRKA